MHGLVLVCVCVRASVCERSVGVLVLVGWWVAVLLAQAMLSQAYWILLCFVPTLILAIFLYGCGGFDRTVASTLPPVSRRR